MKKNNIILVAAIALMAATAACSKKKDEGEKPVPPHPVLGTITFATTQTWSDAVKVSAAEKTTYDSGDNVDGYKVDFRSNPGYKGSLFSWPAVNQYKAVLCPAPWRIPTKQDFINLDKALGGTGEFQTNPTLRDKYLNDWGGTYGGYCYPDGPLDMQSSGALYWSQSEFGADSGYSLFFGADNHIWPQNDSDKNAGYPIRCVK